jgi:hypothetical protein
MLRLLWPTKRKPDPSLLGRLGRVVHWFLTLVAVPVALLGVSYIRRASSIDVTAPPSGGWESTQQVADWHWEQGTQWLLLALGLFVAGRTVRYVLSAE